MDRVDNHRHADAGLPRDRTGLVHGAIGRQMAEPVIGIDACRPPPWMGDGDPGNGLADALPEAIGVEGQEPDAVAPMALY